MIICINCREVKNSSLFYDRPNGNKDKTCKECRKIKSKENRQSNLERYREADKKRYAESPKRRENKKRYNSTETAKEKHKLRTRRNIDKFPEKKRARGLLHYHIKKGNIIRPDICSSCSKNTLVHGHHHDYSRPLEVEWLCSKCHYKEHNSP